MTRISLTKHAIRRARLRWLEPTDAEAVRAIRLVLERGHRRNAKGCTIYQYGTRCVRVARDNVAVTVTVQGMKRMDAIRHQAREDRIERA